MVDITDDLILLPWGVSLLLISPFSAVVKVCIPLLFAEVAKFLFLHHCLTGLSYRLLK